MVQPAGDMGHAFDDKARKARVDRAQGLHRPAGHQHQRLAGAAHQARQPAVAGIGGGEQPVVDGQLLHRRAAAPVADQHGMGAVAVRVELRRAARQQRAGAAVGREAQAVVGKAFDVGPALAHLAPAQSAVALGIEGEVAVQVAQRDVQALLHVGTVDPVAQIGLAGLMREDRRAAEQQQPHQQT